MLFRRKKQERIAYVFRSISEENPPDRITVTRYWAHGDGIEGLENRVGSVEELARVITQFAPPSDFRVINEVPSHRKDINVFRGGESVGKPYYHIVYSEPLTSEEMCILQKELDKNLRTRAVYESRKL